MSQGQQQAQAFDLIIEGVGYLNRIRLVTPKKGDAYLACTINAMMGTADNIEYVGIDCIVVGKIAKQAIDQLAKDVENRQKVIVGFRAGDPKPDFYEYPDRDSGEMKQGSGLKARLLQLTFAKVNGQRVEIPVVPRPAAAPAPEGHSGVDGGGSAGDGSARRVPVEA